MPYICAIVTKQNADGTFDEVGMDNRTIVGNNFGKKRYKSVQTLVHYGLPNGWKGRHNLRIECYRCGELLHETPFATYYVTADFPEELLVRL